MERLSPAAPADAEESGSRKWLVCGLLFLATMLMYMDRQTLAAMSVRITHELDLTNTQYGKLEFFFGMAFALGAALIGLVADRVNVRWLYPVMLVGWSLAGVATAFGEVIGQALVPQALATGASAPGSLAAFLGLRGAASDSAYVGLLVCRTLLGFCEAGHWPCALITTQRLLQGANRTLGNSVLQSGASIGAVLTPLVILAMLTPTPGSWRWPFVVIGFVGTTWVIPWLLTVRNDELAPRLGMTGAKGKSQPARPETPRWVLVRRIVVLLAIVIPINITWQYFRAWMPKILQEEYGYGEQAMLWFNSLWFVVADAGCLAAGLFVKAVTARGVSLHLARTAAFFFCVMLTITSAAAAQLPAGWLLLAVFLAIGFGSLGLFPVYYSLGQEISSRRQGLVTGSLGASTWIVTSLMQWQVGAAVDRTHSYASGLVWAGQAPLLGLLALALFWEWESDETAAAPETRSETPGAGKPGAARK